MKTRVISEYEYVSQYDLSLLKENMSLEEYKEIERKKHEILSNLFGFKDIKDRALADLVFEKAYLAAHVDYRKKENTDG